MTRATSATELSCEKVRVVLGGRTVLDDATVTFEGNRLHAVVGRSGAGKSVLLKALTGLLPMTGGRVLVRGDGVETRADAGDDAAFARLRQRVVFVHQDPALLDDLSIEENVRFALLRKRGRGPRQDDEVNAWLERLSLASQRHRLPRELTPGALRRAALCRALVLAPEVLVVDEPTTGLDPVAAREVDDALAALATSGSTLIVITHDVRSLDRLTPTLTWVHEGRVAWRGPYPEEARRVRPDTAPLRALLEGRPL